MRSEVVPGTSVVSTGSELSAAVRVVEAEGRLVATFAPVVITQQLMELPGVFGVESI